jgi:hypothetical protein|tara:strand:- start:478 stop:687 length:210 start_codon:yes stop_codon:yes gene_type:complete
MSLLDKLRAGESALTGLDGASPAIVDQALSTLHKTYSLDGQPYMNNLPSPTQLKATISENDKYLNNLPE